MAFADLTVQVANKSEFWIYVLWWLFDVEKNEQFSASSSFELDNAQILFSEHCSIIFMMFHEGIFMVLALNIPNQEKLLTNGKLFFTTILMN